MEVFFMHDGCSTNSRVNARLDCANQDCVVQRGIAEWSLQFVARVNQDRSA